MTGNAPQQTSTWIVNKRFDLLMLGLPYAASILSLATLSGPMTDPPLWLFLLVIVSFDVSHVWSTLHITYLDKSMRKERRWLLWLTPPIAFLGGLRLHSHSPALFWTVLAYIAIFHFMKQQWGFIALYKARLKERERLDLFLDKWTLYVGALSPVLLWHGTPSRQFDWFNAGEKFIFKLDPAFRPDILFVMAAFAVLWVGRQVQRWVKDGFYNPGKVMWMVAAWVSWTIGIMYAEHPLVSAAFLNLLHGIPFMMLVWVRTRRQAERNAQSGMQWLTKKKNWLLFYGICFIPAFVEEGFWDAMVWHIYAPHMLHISAAPLTGMLLSFWVALLSLPQLSHYILDAWVWKLDGSNPGLRDSLRI
ncbi:MAG: hypothetical protein GY822_12920 [Deltaproteobacteria bacterium]|nr:hypothetical protein [Deltaproteobacteria bacterium]